MFFLIRCAFWVTLVLVAIPFFMGGVGERAGATVGPLDAYVAARDAVGDITGICERKPDVCEVGGQFLHTIGVHAREGARYAYEALDGHFGTPEDKAAIVDEQAAPVPALPVPAPRDQISTGSVPAR